MAGTFLFIRPVGPTSPVFSLILLSVGRLLKGVSNGGWWGPWPQPPPQGSGDQVGPVQVQAMSDGEGLVRGSVVPEGGDAHTTFLYYGSFFGSGACLYGRVVCWWVGCLHDHGHLSLSFPNDSK